MPLGPRGGPGGGSGSVWGLSSVQGMGGPTIAPWESMDWAMGWLRGPRARSDVPPQEGPKELLVRRRRGFTQSENPDSSVTDGEHLEGRVPEVKGHAMARPHRSATGLCHTKPHAVGPLPGA